MIGRTISHYTILEKLGEGGMGVVYKARDIHLDRFVAIKVLPAEKVADPERKQRFVQEAKAASSPLAARRSRTSSRSSETFISPARGPAESLAGQKDTNL